MATKAKAVKPAIAQTKKPEVDALLAKFTGPTNKRPSKARATTVLAALELTKGENIAEALKRRGLKVS
jgi:hypothetical protein